MKVHAKHAIVTDVDRRSIGDAGAFDAAVNRLRDEYEDLCKCHPVGAATDFLLDMSVVFDPEDEPA